MKHIIPIIGMITSLLCIAYCAGAMNETNYEPFIIVSLEQEDAMEIAGIERTYNKSYTFEKGQMYTEEVETTPQLVVAESQKNCNYHVAIEGNDDMKLGETVYINTDIMIHSFHNIYDSKTSRNVHVLGVELPFIDISNESYELACVLYTAVFVLSCFFSIYTM